MKKLCDFRNNISFAPNTLKFNPITPIAMNKLFALVVLLTALTTALAQPAHYIMFNGTDQYMVIPHHEDFNIAADQSFTVTGWVRNETYTNYPRYVCKRDMSVQSSGSERTGYEFFGTGSAGQSLGLNTPTSTSGHALSIYTGVTVPAGEWMHFALVVDRPNNEIRIYHNGETNSSWVMMCSSGRATAAACLPTSVMAHLAIYAFIAWHSTRMKSLLTWN